MKHEPRWRSEALNVVAAAVIALLVWAYANDRTRETATLAGTVRLSPADPRATWVAPSAAVTVSVELRGSRRSIERAENALRAGIPLSPGADGVPSEPGSHVLALRDVLQANAAIAESGAELVRVRPETVPFEVGELVTEQVPVTAVLPSASVSGDIAVEPAVVSLTVPAAARQALGRLAVDAIVDTKNLEPGKPQQVDVDLRLPESLGRWRELCRVVPPRAKVSFALLKADSEFRIESVPVRVSVPADVAQSWTVAAAPGAEAISGVVVSGPRASIDALRSGTFAAAAIVDLASAPELPGRVRQAVSFWRLPEGVSVIEAGGLRSGEAVLVDLVASPRP